MKISRLACLTVLLALPAQAAFVSYTFDVTAGTLVWDWVGVQSTSGGMTGTFAVTVDDQDGHLGESDTFVLEDADLTNSTHLAISISGLATAHLYPGTIPGTNGVHFLDFLPVAPAHIASGGTATVDSDVYLTMFADVSGMFNTPFYTHTWADTNLPIHMSFSTSVSQSDTLVATMAFVRSWVLGVPDIQVTMTLDFIVNVEGTAHMVPEPALAGTVAVGITSAGIWVRCRRYPRPA
jgi:hypothetical protein